MIGISGQADEALSVIQDAIAAARHSNDTWLLLQALNAYSICMQELNRTDDGLSASREAARIAKGTDSPYLSALALSFLAFDLSTAGLIGKESFYSEALSLAEQVLDYVKSEKSSTKVARVAFIAKCHVFLGRENWNALLETGQDLCHQATAARDHAAMGFAFLWIVLALQKSGHLEECIAEAKKALEILGALHPRQIDCEKDLHRFLIESLAQLRRWDAIWQHADAVLAPPPEIRLDLPSGWLC
jgi:tetratricopeptide (TPR) repeat protein